MERPEGAALFVAMPERHLRSAVELGRTQVVLPLGRLGDVASAPSGCVVYCVALDQDGVAEPAATWRATLVGWQEPDEQDPDAEPEGLPPTWLAERAAERSTPSESPADDPDDEDDVPWENRERPRQVFVRVEGLEELDRSDWIFGNEVVPKQQRGARSFVPMTPTLVRLPD